MRARVETGKDAPRAAADAAAARRTTTTTTATLRVGAACRARASFDEEMRAGEIVDAREEAGGSGRVTAYYVHYRDLNKRLDEWVRAEDVEAWDGDGGGQRGAQVAEPAGTHKRGESPEAREGLRGPARLCLCRWLCSCRRDRLCWSE